MKKLAVFAVAAVLAATAFAGYGWYEGSATIGGTAIGDFTAWTQGGEDIDLGTFSDLTISSVAFNIWSDANDRAGANMFFRLWDGGQTPAGDWQDIHLGSASRIEGKEHDFAISFDTATDLNSQWGVELVDGKEYYLNIYAKSYNGQEGGDEFYGSADSPYQTKFVYQASSPAVPEPATMSLLGLGALAMVLRRKLRK